MTPSRSRSQPLPRGFGALFLTLFVDLLGFGIVIPILPFVIEKQGGSGTLLGLILGSYSLMQFLCAPFWGRLSDKVGRRPVLLVSIAGNCVSMLLMALFPTHLGLFLGRLLGGACAANISTAYAYVADVTTAENRSKGMGILGAGFALGFTIGPAIGGVLSAIGYSAPMLFAAGLAALNFAVTYARLPEPEHRSHSQLKPGIAPMFRVLSQAPLCAFGVALFFVFTVAISQMEVGFTLHLIKKFGWTAMDAGYLAAAMGICMAAIQGGAVGKLGARFGEARVMLAGFLLTAIGFWCVAQTTGLVSIVIAAVLVSTGRGIAQPSLSAFVSLAAPPAQVGLILGFFQSAGSLGRIAGPPVAGLLFDRGGQHAPFYFAAAVLCGALLVGWRGLKASLWMKAVKRVR